MSMFRDDLGQEARNTLPNLSRTGNYLITGPIKKKQQESLRNSLKFGSNS